MITVKVTFKNGDHLTTDFNGTMEDARAYYIGQAFNLGPVEDNMQIAESAELIEACDL